MAVYLYCVFVLLISVYIAGTRNGHWKSASSFNVWGSTLSLGSQETLKRHWFYTVLRPPASERGQSCEDETQVGTKSFSIDGSRMDLWPEALFQLSTAFSTRHFWNPRSNGALSMSEPGDPKFDQPIFKIWIVFSFFHFRIFAPVLTSVVQWPTAEKKTHVNHGSHAISLQEAWRLAFFGLTSKVFLIESLARILGFSDESSKQVLRFPGNCNGKATALSASSLAEASQQL